MSNIAGINLNIDDNYLNEAVKNTVMAGIVEMLDKDKIVSGLVNTVLETKVDKEGCVNSYSSYNTYTLLEYYINKILKEVVKEEMKKLVEEKKPVLQETIRKELNKKATLNKFIGAFLDSTLDNLDNTWRTKIEVNYEKNEDY